MKEQNFTVLEKTNECVKLLQECIENAREQQWTGFCLTFNTAGKEGGHHAIFFSNELLGLMLQSLLRLGSPPPTSFESILSALNHA